MTLEKQYEESFISFEHYLSDVSTSLEQLALDIDDEFSMEANNGKRDFIKAQWEDSSLSRITKDDVKDKLQQTKESLYKASKAIRDFLTRVASTIQKTNEMIKGLIRSGLPIFKKRLVRFTHLLDQINRAEFKTQKFEDRSVESLLTNHAGLITTNDLIKGLEQISTYSQHILGDEKNRLFVEFSDRMLEPFAHSIQTSKTDNLVVGLGVISMLLNPTIIVGEVLKKLFNQTVPYINQGVDIATAGTSLRSLVSAVTTLGAHTTTTLRNWSNQQMDISEVPKYRAMYPFCKNEVKPKEPSIIQLYRSPTMLKGAYWEVCDYVDVLFPKQKGSVLKPGAQFKTQKYKLTKREIKPLTKTEVQKVLSLSIESLKAVIAYCNDWGSRAETYQKQYRSITTIVMNKGEDNFRHAYIRHTYQSAMTGLLTGIWQKCYGSDMRFIHYINDITNGVSKYCDHSLSVKLNDS